MLPLILDHREEAQCYESAEKQAEYFGLSHLLEKNPYELSGGEKQRVAICRALVSNPELILADEPTGNLDTKSSKQVINALQKINTDMGKSVVLVTHDPYMASFCKRVMFLKDGEIVLDQKKQKQDNFYDEIIALQKDIFEQ